ncbi:hypothetical protein [Couchioplanes azureus]|uniref:hypothetical protein n=1 Tax=Couchioplanes caeruleus TaxID=56438 RepID=UPI0016717FC2|nr:hypothetical protein [Couchioplanes caeruleus]GGQ87302.1 hypothetical protein GCM10010166_66880 [Couchioplanes caeruleus subsp. azureus]
MADHSTGSPRRLWHLAGSWSFAIVSAVIFAWLTTGAYIRQMLLPLTGEADIARRECQSVPACAPDAADLIDQQLSLLRHTRILVLGSAWTVAILAFVTAVTTTLLLLLLRGRGDTGRRILGLLWKIQAACTAVLLVAQGTFLHRGASTLATTPEAARLFTSIKVFDSPFTDAGNLYYLAWFIAASIAATALTRILHRSL